MFGDFATLIVVPRGGWFGAGAGVALVVLLLR